MKKNENANMSLVGAALIVVAVLILALVVPWSLSLVESRGFSRGLPLIPHVGMPYLLSASTHIEFFEPVEVDSIEARLYWMNSVGTCHLSGQAQSSNIVGGAATFQFRIQTVVAEGGSGTDQRVTYIGSNQSGHSENIGPGVYWFVITAQCTELAQAWTWFELYSLTRLKYDSDVLDPNGLCIDENMNGQWDWRDECQSMPPAYVLYGTSLRDDDDEPPNGDNGDNNVTDNETDEKKTLVDGDVDRAAIEDMDWLVIVLIGLVIFIGAVVIAILFKM